MKYKAGDEVLVKGAITDVHEGTDHPYFVAVNYDSVHWVSEEKVFPADKTYEQGLADAWELAQRIMKKRDWDDIDGYFKHFGIRTYCELFEKYSYEEALAKIEAYEKEKEIKVGDVVESITSQRKFLIVTEETDDDDYDFGVIDLETMMIDRICNDTRYFKNTGKHIDIESLLKQIGE